MYMCIIPLSDNLTVAIKVKDKVKKGCLTSPSEVMARPCEVDEE